MTPACPKRKDPIDGSLVETYWCPISGSCEQYCFSYLEMQEDKTTLWGPEWLCASSKLEFCALEGMCNYPESCPLSTAGEFGGASWPPGPQRKLTDDVSGDEEDIKWTYQ